MKFSSLRRVVGRFQHHRAADYATQTADCREELALIADRRRSEPFGA